MSTAEWTRHIGGVARLSVPGRVPASERLFAAYLAAGGGGAAAEAANIAEEGREDVRRVLAAVSW